MGDHFYTTDVPERDAALTRAGYHYERVECYVFPVGPSATPTVPGTTPLLRLFNPDTGDHFYTTSSTEAHNAVSGGGYRSEQISCFVFPGPAPGAVPLFRLWNGENDHFYTISTANRDSAINDAGYTLELIACYVLDTQTPISSPFFRLYKPGRGFWDDVGDFFSGVGNAIGGLITTVGGAVVDGLDGVFGWPLDAGAWLLENTIFNIPWVGGALRDFWNGVLTIGWGILSFFDSIAGSLGFRPEKRMKIMVIVQLDELGNTVTTSAKILPLLQAAIDTFKNQANVRLLPVGPFIFSSPFQDLPSASGDYILTETDRSGADTLNVNCDDDLLYDDVGSIGTKLNTKLSRDLFFAGWRRVLGYGAPVAAFAVRSFKNKHSSGCSLGPLADYVVVNFNGVSSVRVLPHELGHACNLWHPRLGTGEAPDPDNLMTPDGKGGVGFSLNSDQIVLLRASRHVTYF